MRKPRQDPYHDHKLYHLAHLMSPGGRVSPLCAGRPRPLDLTRELWTLRPEAVTCPKCLEKIQERNAHA